MANDNYIYDAEVKLVPEASVYLVNSSTLALYKSVSEHSNDNRYHQLETPWHWFS